MDLGRGFSQYRAAHEHFEPHSGCDMWEELAGETDWDKDFPTRFVIRRCSDDCVCMQTEKGGGSDWLADWLTEGATFGDFNKIRSDIWPPWFMGVSKHFIKSYIFIICNSLVQREDVEFVNILQTNRDCKFISSCRRRLTRCLGRDKCSFLVPS